ncbi:MAG: DUF6111 family protein [Xanthobacteraceae bacterium]|nr:DUF6111 family protein [Xanthobacteraceae bacterium]
MIRPVLTEVGIFLVPFAAYALFLVLTRAGFLNPASWSSVIILRLALGALVLVAASVLLLVRFSGAPAHSTYEPAHFENGRLVPGTEQ